MKRALCMIAAIVFAITACVTASAEAKELTMKPKSFYKEIIEREIKYVNTLTLKNGSIGMNRLSVSSYPASGMPEVDGISAAVYTTWPSAKIMPYFSEFAALGALRGDEALGTRDAADSVLAFINWYISHMNTTESDINGLAGTVYDYYVFYNKASDKTIEVTLRDTYQSQTIDGSDNTYDYDSTDSYASLFIELLYEYNRVYDNTFLNGKEELIDTLISVIKGTFIEKIGLTGAKPNYMVAYLMDNCEVYCGLSYAEKAYREIFNNTEKADSVKQTAERIRTAILDGFWREDDKAFVAGVFEDGSPAYGTSAEDMKNFYPQQTAQLFPVAFGLIDSSDERAVYCYNGFNAEFGQSGVSGHDWVALDKGGDYPWALILRAAYAMGDTQRCNDYIVNVNRRYIMSNHAYPYYNAEAGHVLFVAAMMYGEAEDDLSAEESSAVPESSAAASEAAVSEASAASAEASSQAPSDGGNTALWISLGAAAAAIAAVVAVLIRKKKK